MASGSAVSSTAGGSTAGISPRTFPRFPPENEVRSGLSAGGRWIRTIGPPVSCELYRRGPPLLPARERERFSAISAAQRAFQGADRPSGLGGLRFIALLGGL